MKTNENQFKMLPTTIVYNKQPPFFYRQQMDPFCRLISALINIIYQENFLIFSLKPPQSKQNHRIHVQTGLFCYALLLYNTSKTDTTAVCYFTYLQKANDVSEYRRPTRLHQQRTVIANKIALDAIYAKRKQQYFLCTNCIQKCKLCKYWQILFGPQSIVSMLFNSMQQHCI